GRAAMGSDVTVDAGRARGLFPRVRSVTHRADLTDRRVDLEVHHAAAFGLRPQRTRLARRERPVGRAGLLMAHRAICEDDRRVGVHRVTRHAWKRVAAMVLDHTRALRAMGRAVAMSASSDLLVRAKDVT